MFKSEWNPELKGIETLSDVANESLFSSEWNPELKGIETGTCSRFFRHTSEWNPELKGIETSTDVPFS